MWSVEEREVFEDEVIAGEKVGEDVLRSSKTRSKPAEGCIRYGIIRERETERRYPATRRQIQ